jgi:uncharacterized membrane protein
VGPITTPFWAARIGAASTTRPLASSEKTNNAVSAALDVLLLRSAMASLKILSAAQRIGVVIAAIFYVVAGALHFIKPEPYLRIMPPYVSWHIAMVRVSGVFEILGGLGLLVPETRRTAAWGLIALLIAVFPANIYMATHPIESGVVSIAPVLRWARLPLQLLLAWWLLWCTKLRPVARTK